jgi:uncharacterized damage-inducible protein DinB
MENKELYALRFPIGEYSQKTDITNEDIKAFIDTIDKFPQKLNEAVTGLADEQLDTRYREGGWTIRQVVHHVADSHTNSYIRFKLTITEDKPTIRPYDEAVWSELPEAKTAPIALSLKYLELLHKKIVETLRNVTPAQVERKYYHPESKTEGTLGQLMGLYAWHCEHHLAHIVNLKKRMNW